ncbi:hypothetical protein ACIRRH_36735 [Kitasatospora sp. NPDC101235]|uniref:hypothetical protein n=1 Tax=Kitasatospora sp. NPDC101235 TaxID=3364101 RepID=UPI0038152307
MGVGGEGSVDPADVEQVLAPVPDRRLLRARHQDARAQGLGGGGRHGEARRGEMPGLRPAGLRQRHALSQALGLEPSQPLLGLLDPVGAAMQLVELFGGRQGEAVERHQDVVIGLQIPVHESAPPFHARAGQQPTRGLRTGRAGRLRHRKPSLPSGANSM